MERITTFEEFSKYVQVWFDDENDTIILKSEYNLVIDSDSNVIINSSENLLIFSDHINNKKIFQNTGIFSSTDNVLNMVANAEEEYINSMNELFKKHTQLKKILVDIEVK